MRFTRTSFFRLFVRRCRRHPARRLSHAQAIESMEPRLLLSATSSADQHAPSTGVGDDWIRGVCDDAAVVAAVDRFVGIDEVDQPRHDELADSNGRADANGSGDDEAEDSIIVDYGAVGLSRGSDVLISSYQSSGSHGGDSIPQDSFSLNFSKIETYPAESRDDALDAGSTELTAAPDDSAPVRAPINHGDFDDGPKVEYLDVVETGGL